MPGDMDGRLESWNNAEEYGRYSEYLEEGDIKAFGCFVPRIPGSGILE